MEYEYQLYLNYIRIACFTYADILLVGDSWGRTIHICRPKNTLIFNCSHFKLYVFAKLEIVWSSLTMLESSCSAIYFGSILGVILFAMNTLSQFLTNPRNVHLIDAKHILRYLRGTVDYELKYEASQNINLEGTQCHR